VPTCAGCGAMSRPGACEAGCAEHRLLLVRASMVDALARCETAILASTAALRPVLERLADMGVPDGGWEAGYDRLRVSARAALSCAPDEGTIAFVRDEPAEPVVTWWCDRCDGLDARDPVSASACGAASTGCITTYTRRYGTASSPNTKPIPAYARSRGGSFTPPPDQGSTRLRGRHTAARRRPCLMPTDWAGTAARHSALSSRRPAEQPRPVESTYGPARISALADRWRATVGTVPHPDPRRAS